MTANGYLVADSDMQVFEPRVAISSSSTTSATPSEWARPPDAVLEVCGSPPEDFESIVRRYVAASPFVERSFGSKLRAGAAS